LIAKIEPHNIAGWSARAWSFYIPSPLQAFTTTAIDPFLEIVIEP
jgi:hypothetical protein